MIIFCKGPQDVLRVQNSQWLNHPQKAYRLIRSPVKGNFLRVSMFTHINFYCFWNNVKSQILLIYIFRIQAGFDSVTTVKTKECKVAKTVQGMTTALTKNNEASQRILIFLLTKTISFVDCNGTRTHNHFLLKRTLNHLAKLTKWLSYVVSTYP